MIKYLLFAQEAEIAKLTALLQKTEMKAKSLELTVEQKSKENEVRKLLSPKLLQTLRL